MLFEERNHEGCIDFLRNLADFSGERLEFRRRLGKFAKVAPGACANFREADEVGFVFGDAQNHFAKSFEIHTIRAMIVRGQSITHGGKAYNL